MKHPQAEHLTDNEIETVLNYFESSFDGDEPQYTQEEIVSQMPDSFILRGTFTRTMGRRLDENNQMVDYARK